MSAPILNRFGSMEGDGVGYRAGSLPARSRSAPMLRPLGKLVIVEPTQSLGASDWKPGVGRLATVVEQLGMHVADTGTGLLAFVVVNGSTPPAEGAAYWTSIRSFTPEDGLLA